MNRDGWIGGFLFVLGVVLLILKLAGIIAWPWWLVLIPWGILFVFFLVIGIILAVGAIALIAAGTYASRKGARRG